MTISSRRMWLGGVTVAGLLLASSLPAIASTQGTNQATAIRPTVKLLASASTVVPTGSLTDVVRKEMQWVSSPEVTKQGSAPVNTDKTVPAQDTSVAATAKPAPAPNTAQSTNNTAKPVQVAATPQQQVSRSDNSTLVNHALSLIGVPYVFGGTSRSGFDCSGYTRYVFAGSGISLPRTSYAQFNSGSSVSRDQLQPGDLVFFSTYSKGASHVGIYIGGGRFVHAGDSGVATTSLSESYYAKRYLGARRVR